MSTHHIVTEAESLIEAAITKAIGMVRDAGLKPTAIGIQVRPRLSPTANGEVAPSGFFAPAAVKISVGKEN